MNEMGGFNVNKWYQFSVCVQFWHAQPAEAALAVGQKEQKIEFQFKQNTEHRQTNSVLMKLVSTIARFLLGLIFVVFGLNFWFGFIPIPPFPEGSQAGAFMGAMYLSGFLKVVKVLEVVGGLLLLIGRFTNLALAILGPIIVNIAMFHVFLVGGGYAMPALIGMLALIVLAGRKDFTGALLAVK
jgi:putative oxidoreductase